MPIKRPISPPCNRLRGPGHPRRRWVWQRCLDFIRRDQAHSTMRCAPWAWPIRNRSRVMGSQADRSVVSGYLSDNLWIPLRPKSMHETPVAVGGYTHMFETGHAVDYGLAWAKPDRADRRDAFHPIRSPRLLGIRQSQPAQLFRSPCLDLRQRRPAMNRRA